MKENGFYGQLKTRDGSGQGLAGDGNRGVTTRRILSSKTFTFSQGVFWVTS